MFKKVGHVLLVVGAFSGQLCAENKVGFLETLQAVRAEKAKCDALSHVVSLVRLALIGVTDAQVTSNECVKRVWLGRVVYDLGATIKSLYAWKKSMTQSKKVDNVVIDRVLQMLHFKKLVREVGYLPCILPYGGHNKQGDNNNNQSLGISGLEDVLKFFSSFLQGSEGVDQGIVSAIEKGIEIGKAINSTSTNTIKKIVNLAVSSGEGNNLVVYGFLVLQGSKKNSPKLTEEQKKEASLIVHELEKTGISSLKPLLYSGQALIAAYHESNEMTKKLLAGAAAAPLVACLAAQCVKV